MKKSLLFKIVVIVLAFVGSISAVNAQVTTSAMNGTVTDDKGALPGATVVAVHGPTGTVYKTITRNDGRYNFANINVGGPYTVTATMVGYTASKNSNINLGLGQNFKVDFKLQESSQSLAEVTIVSNQNKTINNSRTGAQTSVSREQLEKLPTFNRSVTDLTKLTPQSNSQGDGFSFAGRNNKFNSFTIDGSQFNNSFGLTAMPGGGTGAQPISLDALDQITINIAPYDVKQGGFTGGSVNAVTKSGTNNFSGSVYTFYKDQNLQGYKVGDAEIPKTAASAFTNKIFGARIGGPIVKDKLFFFINGEITRRAFPGTTLSADRGQGGSNVTKVKASDLDAVKSLLISKWGYDPGVYEGYSSDQQADNLTARLDWNINENNKLTIRYNYLKSFKDIDPSSSNSNSGRGPTINSTIFSNMRYRFFNNTKSIAAELNSKFGNRFSNNLQVSYSAFRDYREIYGSPFPVVDIENGAGSNYISLGSEPFSGLNTLDQDVYSFTDNFNIYAGSHNITIGASGQYLKYGNGFAQFVYGQFRYKSVADFLAAAGGNNSVNPSLYQLTYSANGDPRPIAKLSMAPIAVYVQDEWFVRDNFKLTYGVRADIPIYTSEITSNPAIVSATFRDGEKLDVGKLPKTQILISPRVGFNWDVNGDQTFQLRGGSGIFTGGMPGVYLVNQAGQTGLLFGNEFTNNPTNRPFTSNVSAYIPSNAGIPASYAINATASDFKIPQVWRSNLAADFKLPGGILATLEGIYTKSINEIYHRDANLVNPTGKLTGTGDTRDIFPGSSANRINNFLTNAIVLDNTNKGYAYNLTAQLQKRFGRYVDAMIAYTYSDARDVTSTPGSQANSAFTGNQIVNDPNNPILAYSSYVVKNRIVAAVNFNFEIAPKLPTSVGVIYEGSPYGDSFGDTRFSYIVSGNLNNDNGTGNDLMYVPKDKNDINFVTTDVKDSRGNVTFAAESADSQWARLDAYISQDKYLSTRRGQYAERNGAEYAWTNRFDLRITQDFFTKWQEENKSRFQISVDFVNFGNLLNKDWGLTKVPNLNNFMQLRSTTAGVPQYTVDKTLSKTFRDNTSIASRYQVQVGVRYSFN
ncbi:TonB-dependent receptor [Pedobacter sp. V48]|uniref:TonB-dependent receptor n=1 Tax=Pedobacter sp. V48 TaxID=509635 RepID=UPI001377BF09|nr:TonB-dependent receptor [Pedobacter sp. V48]